ncbi:hypothetical protein NMG60_11007354 [Bertholletia excelsa]
MGEKGGKGFSLNGDSFKTSVATNGKDDSSTKSRRGRKVQFDSEELFDSKVNSSSKSGGKGEIPIGKGDWGKSGKGDKISNGAKTSVPKQPSTLELKIEHELPQNATCLMDCEAADILEGIHEHMVILSEDPAIKIPISFDRGLQYAKRGDHYTSPEAARQALEPLKNHGVSDGEICMIANTCPESVNEVFALVPSLKGKKKKLSEPLKDALNELAKIKRSI